MDRSKKRRIIQSMCLLWAFVGLGWAVGQRGPSFMDLRMIVNKDLDTASWIFTVTAIGYMVGSLLGGILYDRFNKELMIALSAVVLSAFTGVIPWCKWFSAMMVANFISGFGSGWLDTGGNANIISLWGATDGSYMQALHFCFGIGGIIAPVATEPFLAKPVCKLVQENDTKSGLHLNDSFDNTTYMSTCISSYEKTNIHFAYLTTFFVVLSSGIPFFIIYTTWTARDINEATQDNGCDTHRHNSLPVRQKIAVITLLFFVMLTYCAVEEAFFSYLATFCISYLHWSSSTSSYATSIFWITYSVGRLSGIFLIRKFRTVQLLFSFLSMAVLSFIGFLIASLLYLTNLIWLFIALIGFSMSITFPAVLTWTQENVLEVSGVFSSVFLIAASCGQMLNPLFLGYLMDNISPIWFVYILFGESCLCLIIFSLVYNYTIHCISSISVVPVEIRSVKDIVEITHI